MNRLTIIAVGSKPAGWVHLAEQEYCKRLSSWHPQVITVKPGHGAKAKETEGKRMLAQIPTGSTPVACQLGKHSPTSPEFAKQLQLWLADGGVSFLLGGQQGLAPAVLAHVNTQLALSALTFAHELARVILLEQCYRGMCILNGHPYHQE